MAELSNQHKEAIVLLLARFTLPAEVVATMREEFGVEDLTVRQVTGYDPTRPAFEAGDKWREIFYAARKVYLEDVASVPIANQGYRLNLLQQGVLAAVKAKNWNQAAQLAEQAAKEVGGVLTNQRHLHVEGKGRARDLTAEERKEQLFAVLDEALAKRQVDAGTGTTQ